MILMYVVNTTRGDKVCREHLSCTQSELLRELARKVGVEPIFIIYYHVVPHGQRHLSDMDLLRIYGSAETFKTT